jgi:hypothetical protein
MILQQTTSIFSNLPPDSLIVTTTQHQFVRYRKITGGRGGGGTQTKIYALNMQPMNVLTTWEEVSSFAIRPSCDQTGLQRMPLREPTLISRQRTTKHTHTPRANDSTDDKALMNPVT